MNSSDKDFWDLFQQISNCGKAILDVESKALDSSLLSLFNRRNHANFVSRLAQEIKNLQTLAIYIQKSAETKKYILTDGFYKVVAEMDASKAETMNKFIQELIGLATALSTVCEGLHGKTLNMPYSHAQYIADVELVRVKKMSCNLAQTNLFK